MVSEAADACLRTCRAGFGRSREGISAYSGAFLGKNEANQTVLFEWVSKTESYSIYVAT